MDAYDQKPEKFSKSCQINNSIHNLPWLFSDYELFGDPIDVKGKKF